MRLRRLRIILAALTLVLTVAGCATSSYDTAHPKPGGPLAGHEVADSNNDGTYVTGDGITYQLQISRQLNPYAVEDSQYIRGLPTGTVAPNAQQLWYGVFLWAKNQYHRSYQTSDNFEIVDTEGDVYRPLALNPAKNEFAWTAQTLAPGATEPGEDTAAANTFTQGGLLLFKLNDSAYNNRPLTLYILNAQNQKIDEISLDL